MAFILIAPAFADCGETPERFTCEGADMSPPLHWLGAPEITESFVLIGEE